MKTDDSDSRMFTCFDCGGEAEIYAVGEVACLDPSSSDYVCSPDVDDIQASKSLWY